MSSLVCIGLYLHTKSSFGEQCSLCNQAGCIQQQSRYRISIYTQILHCKIFDMLKTWFRTVHQTISTNKQIVSTLLQNTIQHNIHNKVLIIIHAFIGALPTFFGTLTLHSARAGMLHPNHLSNVILSTTRHKFNILYREIFRASNNFDA